MSTQTEILVLAIGEPEDGDWDRAEIEALAHYNALLRSYRGEAAVGPATACNLGKGADWPVVAITVGGLFFLVPEMHKRIRESLEEYRRIWGELKSLSKWISGRHRALYPDHYLFLQALFHVAEDVAPESLIFLGAMPLPEDHPDLYERPPLLFSFLGDSTVSQIAVGRDSRVLWSNSLELPPLGPNNSFKPTPLRGAA